MNVSEATFEYPVLGISADNDVWGFSDLRGLTTCGPRTLKDDMQAGMELIDVNGRRWRVTGVRRLGRAGSLVGWWLKSLLSPPQSRIEQELEALGPLELKAVQERVCAAMEAHPEFWCEDDERATALPARLKEVRGVGSIADIHVVLGLDTFEAY
jgi:hypothetical protein